MLFITIKSCNKNSTQSSEAFPPLSKLRAESTIENDTAADPLDLL